MTEAVRALATHNLGPLNAIRVALCECSVGLINGLLSRQIFAPNHR